MKNKIKKQFMEHRVFYLLLFFSLLVFIGGFLYHRYAVDTYYLEGYGYRNNAFHPYFQDGRLFMTFFLGFLGKLHCSYSIAKTLSWSLAFISLFLSILIFYHLFLEYRKKSKCLSAFLSFFFIMNIFLVEFFMFPEYTGVMCFSIFLISLATNMMISYFKSRKIKYLALASLFSFFTAFCYQGTLSLLVLFPIIFTFYYGRDIKTFLQNNLVIALCYFIPSVTTLIVSKLLGSTRTSHGFHFSLAFSKIYEGTKNLISTTFGILPNYMFVCFSSIFILLLFYLFIQKKKKMTFYFFFIYVILAIIIVTLLPHFLVDVSSIWIVPRSNIGLGLLLVMPFVFYYLYIEHIPKIDTLFVSLFILIAIFQFLGWQSLLFDQVKVNILDRMEAREVVRAISQHESSNRMQVQKIAVFNRQFVRYQYDGTHAYGDMNIRAMANDWTSASLISVQLGRQLKQVKFPNKMKDLCHIAENEEKNTVFFRDETVYVCTY